MSTDSRTVIRGTVSSQAGDSVANLDVHLVRLGLRKEAVVGRASTDTDGHYEVSIDPSSDGRPHRVHVSRRGKTIARSEPIIARPGEHTVHVVVPGEGQGSEYERVGQSLRALLDGTELIVFFDEPTVGSGVSADRFNPG